LILNRIAGKFQLKIKDRESAGNMLGETLKDVIKKEDRNGTIVFGIPRGGIIIAEIIARKLSCAFDLVISKRLRASHNEELAIGAVTEDGTTYLNELVINELKISSEYIKNEILNQLEETKRLARIYNHENKFFLEHNVISWKNKTVIIVDDGAATGSTIIAAIRSIRKTKNPKRLVVAIPVSPKGTINLLRNEGIDHIEVITNPQDRNFTSIEQYYQNFDQVTDNQVLGIIQRTLRK
jgi:putative phosphoribosyl transferase